MKILVTGSDGFIGQYVIKELMQYDIDIIATSHNTDNAKKAKWYNKIEYIECDLNTVKDNYYSFFKQPDILIHLAWQGLPHYKELFHVEKNIFSNYNFLKNMISHGLSDINVIGTCLEYGMKDGCLSEEMEPKPEISYPVSKNILRELLDLLKNIYDFNYKWIRLFYMYGEGQSKSSILEQLKKALKDKVESFNMSGGEQLRDYLPVEKVAEYIVKISMQNSITGIINCSSGSPISIRRLVEEYLEKNKKSIKLNLGYYPYADYEPMAFWGDNTKLNEILNK